MIYIGIDFSINSTAITIKNAEINTYISFTPNYIPNKKAYAIHDYISDCVSIRSYEKISSVKDSIEDQSNKIKNADNLSNLIIEEFNFLNINYVDEIRIEGFSFMSKGNSFIDLITYNTFLKVKLIQKFGHIIKVIPPKTLKKRYTTNGNATKCDMLRAYLDKNNNELSTKIKNLNLVTDGEFKIPKPIDDIIDSIALCEISL